MLKKHCEPHAGITLYTCSFNRKCKFV